MKRTLICAAFIAVAFAAPANAAVSAQELLHDYDNAADDVGRLAVSTFVAGIGEGLSWGNTELTRQKATLIFCTSDNLGLSPDRLIRILRVYVTGHPKQTTLPVGLAFVLALRENFPCTGSGNTN